MVKRDLEGTLVPDHMAVPRWVWVATAMFVAGILLGGSYYHRIQVGGIEAARIADLRAIGELKIANVESWRRERLADAAHLVRSVELRAMVARWRGGEDLAQEIMTRLQIEREVFDYVNAVFVDPAGIPILAVPTLGAGKPPGLEPAAARAVAAAMAARRPLLSEPYRCRAGTIHIDAVAPIEAPAGALLGAFVLCNDVTRQFYPMVQSWPTSSASAETLLVARDGDDVLFLNDLRHRANAALALRIPLRQTDVPAVQAVLGFRGPWRGRDYRGEEVVAYLDAVPGSPWFMVAKVDAAELLAEARARTGLVAGMVALAIAAVLALVVLAGRQRRAAVYRALLAAEREQRAANELFRTTLYSIGDAVITSDRAGAVLHLNAVAEKLCGWIEADARGRPVSDVMRLLNEDTREIPQNPVARVLREGVVVGLANHTLLVARDGTERPIVDSAAPIKGPNGEVIGSVIVFRDQSAERAANRELGRLSARHQAILAALPDIVMEVDDRKVYTWANPAGLAFFGDDVLGHEAAHYFVGEQDTYARVRPLFEGDGSTFYVESWQRRRDGEKRLLAWWCRSLKDPQGKVMGALSTGRDITEQRQQEHRAQNTQKLESLATLAGGIAHDFNNILSAFFGYASLAGDHLESGEVRAAARCLDEATRGLGRARDLTRQLLTFARGGEPVRAVVDVGALVHQAARFALAGANLRLDLVVEPGLWSCEIDAGQIGQVIDNLVINARQAMPDGGVLAVHAANVKLEPGTPAPAGPGCYVRVRVEDRGRGIPPEHLNRIFDPFFTTKQSGTGLGLTTAYSIVSRHRGWLAVQSEVGRGTIFDVYLPAAPAGAVASPAAGRVPARLQGKAVLVMDDDEAVSETLAALLRRLGANVTITSNGAAALDRFQQARADGRPLDAVVLDLTIPGESGGKDVLARMLAIDPQVRAVATSGYAEDPVMAEPERFGFRATLPKPHTTDELAAALARALE
jgi:two-component system, cell cycle sensor histidine kinase and response regulator CckA